MRRIDRWLIDHGRALDRLSWLLIILAALWFAGRSLA